ncbi:MAG: flagellar biosynthesis protein FlgB [Actinobacteria bacterium]|nr:flagellar biosynthesis protein FlgB [Actinomycetota bacterium]
MISDLTLDSLQSGLRGLNMRRAAAEDALANIETPGYVARRVDFEDQLSRAIDGGQPLSVTPSTSFSTDNPLPNGNNVQAEDEIVSLTETALSQQLLISATNAKYSLLRTVISGQ